VLRPVGQLGGVSYARTNDVFELPRTNWAKSGLELGKFGGKDGAEVVVNESEKT
jgi:hypothetical protein